MISSSLPVSVKGCFAVIRNYSKVCGTKQQLFYYVQSSCGWGIRTRYSGDDLFLLSHAWDSDEKALTNGHGFNSWWSELPGVFTHLSGARAGVPQILHLAETITWNQCMWLFVWLELPQSMVTSGGHSSYKAAWGCKSRHSTAQGRGCMALCDLASEDIQHCFPWTLLKKIVN